MLDDALKSDAKPKVALWSNMAIVSLGEPQLNTAQLESRLAYFSRRLDTALESALGWYQRAQIAQQLNSWDDYHKSVESGFNSMVSDVARALKNYNEIYLQSLRDCEELVRAKFLSEKTTESLWQIFKFTRCDGRFSVPLGHLLIAHNRIADAKFAQFEVLRNFVEYRRYYLPLKECLLHPALLLLELAARDSEAALMECLQDIRELTAQNRAFIPHLLTFISERNQELFTKLNQNLKGS